MMADEIVEKDLSFKIMKAAFEVHNQLGPGFLESLYEQAMAIELKSQGMDVVHQKHVVVRYKGQVIGEHILDAVINKMVILEYKAVSELAPIHEQQALSYLKATGLPLAIVINFGTTRVQFSRVVNTKGKTTHPSRMPTVRRKQP
jgi:GxxExxY protein